MAHVLLYYAHPAQQFSHANAAMWEASQKVEGITRVDLYAEYPRFDIDTDTEQERLLTHDVVVFQFPLFWYSTPALIKEWIDLTLEHGFAYGAGGDKLAGKTMMLALTAAGLQEAYTHEGYQHYPLRTFLTPLEQTARLCKMRFATPFALYGSIQAQGDGRIQEHASAYQKLLTALRDELFDFDVADASSIVESHHIQSLIEG